jgi:hypothetical protein
MFKQGSARLAFLAPHAPFVRHGGVGRVEFNVVEAVNVELVAAGIVTDELVIAHESLLRALARGWTVHGCRHLDTKHSSRTTVTQVLCCTLESVWRTRATCKATS